MCNSSNFFLFVFFRNELDIMIVALVSIDALEELAVIPSGCCARNTTIYFELEVAI